MKYYVLLVVKTLKEKYTCRTTLISNLFKWTFVISRPSKLISALKRTVSAPVIRFERMHVENSQRSLTGFKYGNSQ